MVDRLEILKINLKIINIKAMIDEKILNDDLKKNINDFLFYCDENNDFRLNNSLIKYNFSEFEVLKIVLEFFEQNKEFNDDFKENLNNKIHNSFKNVSLPVVNNNSIFKNLDNLSDSIKFESSIDDLIFCIDVNLFKNEYINQKDLILQLDEFISSIVFKFIKSDFDDNECSKLIGRIRADIENEKISGEISEIVEFYFNQYKIIKNRYLMNQFLNEYIVSDDFKKLVFNYDYDDKLIFEILKKVRNDIAINQIIDKNSIILKLKYYFEETKKKQYYLDYLNKYKKTNKYINKYNLLSKEFNDIINEIYNEIMQDKYIESLQGCLLGKIQRQIEINQTDSRKKLDSLINSFELKENYSQSEIDKANNSIGELIYKNRIRSYQINYKLIEAHLNR